MPLFELKVRETSVRVYHVEAADDSEAVQRLNDGKVNTIKTTSIEPELTVQCLSENNSPEIALSPCA